MLNEHRVPLLAALKTTNVAFLEVGASHTSTLHGWFCIHPNCTCIAEHRSKDYLDTHLKGHLPQCEHQAGWLAFS